MLFVIGPVLLLTPLFAWHYRLSNTQSAYRPQWGFNWPLEGLIWIPPSLIVVLLAVFLWRDTHRLDPYKPLPGQPIEMQAVALDWKWLFIYPGQGVATVNRLVIPAGRPVHLSLTSATVMQSLLMPRLAGQIAAMAGMRTQLNFAGRLRPALSGARTRSSTARASRTRNSTSPRSTPTASRAGWPRPRHSPTASTPPNTKRLSRRSILPHPLRLWRRRPGPVRPDRRASPSPAATRWLAKPTAAPPADGRPTCMIETAVWHFLLGNLSWGALPFVRAWRDPNISEIIGAAAGAVVVIGAVAALALITYLRHGATCGRSGSPAWTTRRSASCTSCWPA